MSDPEGSVPSENVQKLKSLVDASPSLGLLAVALNDGVACAVIIVGPNSAVIHYINKAGELLTGYVSSELVGQHINTLLPARYHEHHTELTANFIHNPKIVMYQRRMGIEGQGILLRRKDGIEISVTVDLCPIQIATGLYSVATVKPAG